jgi:hypothetical protein
LGATPFSILACGRVSSSGRRFALPKKKVSFGKANLIQARWWAVKESNLQPTD